MNKLKSLLGVGMFLEPVDQDPFLGRHFDLQLVDAPGHVMEGADVVCVQHVPSNQKDHLIHNLLLLLAQFRTCS
jgi:hypothetical protein